MNYRDLFCKHDDPWHLVILSLLCGFGVYLLILGAEFLNWGKEIKTMIWENIWNRKKQYLKIECLYKGKSQGSYIEPAQNPVFIPGDDEYKISLIKMTEKDYKKLPEFTGF